MRTLIIISTLALSVFLALFGLSGGGAAVATRANREAAAKQTTIVRR